MPCKLRAKNKNNGTATLASIPPEHTKHRQHVRCLRKKKRNFTEHTKTEDKTLCRLALNVRHVDPMMHTAERAEVQVTCTIQEVVLVELQEEVVVKDTDAFSQRFLGTFEVVISSEATQKLGDRITTKTCHKRGSLLGTSTYGGLEKISEESSKPNATTR